MKTVTVAKYGIPVACKVQLPRTRADLELNQLICCLIRLLQFLGPLPTVFTRTPISRISTGFVNFFLTQLWERV
jgi:hypothetical protein